MSMTAAGFAKEVLKEITWLGATQEPSSADSTLAQQISTRIHAYLTKQNVAYWSPSDIPDEVAQFLIRYMACHVGPSFGKSIADAGMTAAQTMEQRYEQLCTAALPKNSGTPMSSDYPNKRGTPFNFTTGE